jgi:hypothetical protein
MVIQFDDAPAPQTGERAHYEIAAGRPDEARQGIRLSSGWPLVLVAALGQRGL